MSSKPDVIELSSDSSELMSPKPDWTTYFPPNTTGTSSVNKKGKGNVVESSSDFSSFNDSLVSSYHSTFEEDQCVSKKGTTDQADSKKATSDQAPISKKGYKC